MKKKSNLFNRLLFILFIIYLVFYISVESGYYDSNIIKKTILTNEKIKEFENDIKNNKTISLDNYYQKEDKDYSSLASKSGQKITKSVSGIVSFILHNAANVLKKLFW